VLEAQEIVAALQSPAAPLLALQAARAIRGSAAPELARRRLKRGQAVAGVSLAVGGVGGCGGGKKVARRQYGQDARDEEKEAVVHYALQAMDGALFTELLQLMGPTQPAKVRTRH
jgi:hypothetical protein